MRLQRSRWHINDEASGFASPAFLELLCDDFDVPVMKIVAFWIELIEAAFKEATKVGPH